MSDDLRRPAGRPPLADEQRKSVSVTVRLEPKRADAIYAQAAASRTTVPDLIRRALDRQ